MTFGKWFFHNFFRILRSPNDFWADFDVSQATPRALWFGAICLLLGIGLDAAGQIFFVDLTQRMLGQNIALIEKLALVFNMSTPEFVEFFSKQLILLKKQNSLVLLLLPLISFFAIHLFAGALHVTLRGFGFVKTPSAPYDATLYIVSFAQAPVVFAAIPFFGPWIAAVWVLILIVKGLKRNYQLGSFSGAVAVLGPAFFLKLTWSSALQLMALSVPNQYFEPATQQVIHVEQKASLDGST